MINLNSLEAYQFDLPENLIAEYPCEPRDASRLLVVDRKSGTIEHRVFKELPKFLNVDDVLVVNNAKVLKVRLLGNRLLEKNGGLILGGKVEFLLLEELSPLRWEGAFHASVKHKPGVRFLIPTPDGQGLHGKIVAGASQSAQGTVIVEFDRDPVESGAGEVPLPPYIQRKSTCTDEDTYQTKYASRSGAAAAPTAGFHFTPELISCLRSQGVGWEEITLHVGLGTFRPVKVADIREHPMHEERYEISESVAQNVTRAKIAGKRIVAVGTTAVRTLESAWSGGYVAVENNFLKGGANRTKLFLHPGQAQFRVVDRLITNFHLPGSTLLMLVCAFAGRDLVLRAYEEAIRENYRFYSYGDAMLIL